MAKKKKIIWFVGIVRVLEALIGTENLYYCVVDEKSESKSYKSLKKIANMLVNTFGEKVQKKVTFKLPKKRIQTIPGICVSEFYSLSVMEKFILSSAIEYGQQIPKRYAAQNQNPGENTSKKNKSVKKTKRR